jgi:ERCC4-related helicase
MHKLRDYQVRIANDANEILTRKGFVYLACQVRVGKTLMALETCKLFGAKKVLFITKIKAFSSIENDYWNFKYLGDFDLTIINKESIHKIETNDFDVIVCDEAHGLFGTYPKPNEFTKIYRKRFFEIPAILLSGTMSPESYSQLFHQFWICKYAPFKEFKNFYQWANEYVNIKLKYLGYAQVKDYSDARKKDFWHHIRYHILTFTQVEAGFTTDVKENILKVKMKPITYQITERLIKDLVVTSKSGKQIIADTGVKLQQKIHQLFSGTIKYEDGSTQVIDNTKAEFIKEKFKGKKIAIFYNFVAELDMLKQTFGNDLTTDLNDFNATNKNIALQIVSGREGISLAKADYLIFLNLQFSAVSYFQAKDRLTTMERKENDIYWIFAENGIEEKIYKSVMNKKDYTNATFKKDFGATTTKENHNSIRKARLFSS